MAFMNVTAKKARELLDRAAETVTKADIKQILAKAKVLERKMAKAGPLSGFLQDVHLMMDMLGDYWSGDYPVVPWRTIAAIAGALLYVLNPIDLIPDFIPIIGMADDAAVIAACTMLARKDLDEYAKWKTEHGKKTGPAAERAKAAKPDEGVKAKASPAKKPAAKAKATSKPVGAKKKAAAKATAKPAAKAAVKPAAKKKVATAKAPAKATAKAKPPATKKSMAKAPAKRKAGTR